MNDQMEELTQAAYSAYCEAVDGKTFDGRPAPTWGGLGDVQRDGWRAAIKAAFETADALDAADEAFGR